MFRFILSITMSMSFFIQPLAATAAALPTLEPRAPLKYPPKGENKAALGIPENTFFVRYPISPVGMLMFEKEGLLRKISACYSSEPKVCLNDESKREFLGYLFLDKNRVSENIYRKYEYDQGSPAGQGCAALGALIAGPAIFIPLIPVFGPMAAGGISVGAIVLAVIGACTVGAIVGSAVNVPKSAAPVLDYNHRTHLELVSRFINFEEIKQFAVYDYRGGSLKIAAEYLKQSFAVLKQYEEMAKEYKAKQPQQ